MRCGDGRNEARLKGKKESGVSLAVIRGGKVQLAGQVSLQAYHRSDRSPARIPRPL